MKPQLKTASKKHNKAPITTVSVTAAGPVKTQAVNTAMTGVKPIGGASSGLPTFSVERAMLVIEKLRITAADHHQQFVVQGRKAMLELMSQVYEQYYSAKASSEFEAFTNNVRNKLKHLGFKTRESSLPSSLLIRLVFADFDDKQVHVYGRSLEVAFKNETLPEDFKLFVGTEGGFEGIRKSSTDKPKSGDTDKLSIAFSEISNDPTVETMMVKGWRSDEKYRVYVAVLNNDGVADLKDSMLTKEHLEATLLLIQADKQRREKPSKEKTKRTHSDAILALQEELEAAKADQMHLDQQLQIAIAEGDDERCNSIRVAIVKANGRVLGFQEAVRAVRQATVDDAE